MSKAEMPASPIAQIFADRPLTIVQISGFLRDPRNRQFQL